MEKNFMNVITYILLIILVLPAMMIMGLLFLPTLGHSVIIVKKWDKWFESHPFNHEDAGWLY